MKKRGVLGIMLIGLGLALALVNLGLFRGMMFLPLVSLGFLTSYVACGGRKKNSNLGLLIPGCIVGAIGLYAILNEYGVFGRDHGGIFLMMLGIAFLVVMMVHTIHDEDRDFGARFWPIFPAGGLIGTGVIAQSQLNLPFNVWNMIGPVVLVVIGVNLWIKSRKDSGDEVQEAESEDTKKDQD